MDNLNKILKTVFTLFVIILIFGNIFILLKYDYKTLDNLPPINFLYVKSESMYPTLNINDIVIIRKSDIYEVGDIITYSYENKYLITHRIVGKHENLFVTKGDNNNSEDEKKVEIQNVKGKVVFIINKEKKLLIIGLIIVIPIIFISFKYLLFMRNSKEE